MSLLEQITLLAVYVALGLALQAWARKRFFRDR